MPILKSQDGLIHLDHCPHCDYLIMQSDMIYERGKPINCRFCRPGVTHDLCKKCALLLELYEQTPKSPRDYWVMTELFVMLHGSDVCNRKEKSVFEIPDSVRKWMRELVQAWGEEEDAKIMGHKHEWRIKYMYTRHCASGMYCECGAELQLGDVEDAINVLENIAYNPCLNPDANATRARQALQGAT